jgi:hypothetical protein
MKLNKDEQQLLVNAQRKVRRIQIFYLHLVFYFICVALIFYNFYIMVGPYTQIITGINVSTLVLWTLVVIIHAWIVFKGRLIFKKSWEDRKIEAFLNEEKEEETKRWE